MSMEKFKIGDSEFVGYKIPTPQASLLAIRAKNGLLACGYLNIETAEKLGDALAIVCGVNTYSDMLEREVSSVSSAAEKLGVKVGMSGAKALELLS